jgi:hypothetical protein
VRHDLARLLIATAFAIAPLSALAQEDEGPSVELNVLTVEGLTIGTSWIFDADFAQEHNIAVPVPFQLVVPKGDDFLVGTEIGPGGDTIIKYHFVTLDKQWMENIQFIPMTLPLADMEERLQTLVQALAKQVFPAAAAGANDSKIDVARKIEIGPYQAVEVVGRYMNDSDGLVHLRLVGIPNPDRPESIYVVANLLDSRVTVTSLEELAETRSGKTLSSFRYRGQ